ncbi:MAG: hypothetical protein KDA84_22500 [Planctomycetaceae bacterium]|nr:hypothetical protein [Planctomycetaceae bacterium]
MNCDEAFDALTDTNWQDNSALKWHLDFCPRCREMQQVLAPALAMFSGDNESESTGPAPSEIGSSSTHRLPADFFESSPKSHRSANKNQKSSPPFLTPEAVRVAEQTAQSLNSGRSRAAHWQRFTALGLLCLMAVWGFFYVSGSSAKPQARQQPAPVMLADQCLWTNRDNAQLRQTADESSSRWVVLSCVACHLEKSLD